MFEAILATVLGTLMGVLVFCSLIIRFFKTGFILFKVKPRTTPPKIMLDKDLGNHKFMDVNGVRLHYVESGDKTKPLVLFVHGFPESWFSWRHQIKFFNKNYHVVAFDMRGYGESSKPSGVNNYLLPDLVQDIKELVTNLGKPRFHLVAHDWGAAVGWHFAAKYPEMVQTYSSCNLPHVTALRSAQKSSWEQMSKSWYILFFQCPILPELNCMAEDMSIFYRLYKAANLHKDHEVIEAYKYCFRDYTAWNRAINYYRGYLKAGETPGIDDIKVPVIQIFGTADSALSVSAAQNSSKYVRDHTLELLPGVSHWVQQQAPQQVNQLINNFIKLKSNN